MSDQVQFVVELEIAEGKLERFKELAEACIELVRENEPTTIAYVWNLSEDGRKCYILEWYESAAVVPDHFALVGAVLGKMPGVAEVTRFEVFGKLTPEAKAALAATGAPNYPFWAGFTRCEPA
jgi:quinol monooxygenase YgiN